MAIIRHIFLEVKEKSVNLEFPNALFPARDRTLGLFSHIKFVLRHLSAKMAEENGKTCDSAYRIYGLRNNYSEIK